MRSSPATVSHDEERADWARDPLQHALRTRSSLLFHVVATDCTTGKAVYKRLDIADAEAFKWIQASASMPLVSRPVKIGTGKHPLAVVHAGKDAKHLTQDADAVVVD